MRRHGHQKVQLLIDKIIKDDCSRVVAKNTEHEEDDEEGYSTQQTLFINGKYLQFVVDFAHAIAGRRWIPFRDCHSNRVLTLDQAFTPSDEAFLRLCFENYYDAWNKEYRDKFLPDEELNEVRSPASFDSVHIWLTIIKRWRTVLLVVVLY